MDCQNLSGSYDAFQENTFQAVVGEGEDGRETTLIKCTSKLTISISAQSMEDTFTEEKEVLCLLQKKF